MADRIIYYAITDEADSSSQPAGVLRRTERDGAKLDEVFSGALTWVPSPLLRSAEHGDLTNDFIEITEAEADEIVARIRASRAEEQ